MPASRVIGLHIAAGTVYAAVVECPDTPVFSDSFERLVPASGLDPAQQLAELTARFGQELRRINPVAVGVLQTTKNAQWKYADAFRRASIETAIMIATDDAATATRPIRFVQVKQGAMLKALEISLEDLAEDVKAHWGAGISRYAKERGLAFAAATALAGRACS